MQVPTRSLVPFAATLAGLSVVTFLAGALMLGIGVALPSGSASGRGGLLGKLTDVLPSSGGAEKPGWEDGHPVGLHLMTRYWIATGSLEKASYYFTSDGRVYVDLEDGFSDDILAQHKGEHGTVRIDGKEMVITWKNGKDERSELEKSDSGFAWDMGLFAPVEPFEEAKELVGRWEGGTSVSFSGSSSATSNSLDLRDDGSFTGESVASLSSRSSESAVTAGSSSDHSGTWKLDGYTLVLTYSDGRTRRGVTFPFDDEKTPVYPDRFYFAGTMYKKLS